MVVRRCYTFVTVFSKRNLRALVQFPRHARDNVCTSVRVWKSLKSIGLISFCFSRVNGVQMNAYNTAVFGEQTPSCLRIGGNMGDSSRNTHRVRQTRVLPLRVIKLFKSRHPRTQSVVFGYGVHLNMWFRIITHTRYIVYPSLETGNTTGTGACTRNEWRQKLKCVYQSLHSL